MGENVRRKKGVTGEEEGMDEKKRGKFSAWSVKALKAYKGN